MAVGVNTCLRRFGCSTFPHTHLRSLASPDKAKARWGWHGMACFNRVCLCLIIPVSILRPFTPKSDPSNSLCTYVLVMEQLKLIEQ